MTSPSTLETHRAIILVVERDPHIRALETFFLNEAGFGVEFAADGVAALERAREIKPDIIITEVLVPKLDGLALCRAVRKEAELSNTVVLIFSILAAQSRAREAGADAFLMKPLAEQRLVQTVRELLAKRSGGAASGACVSESNGDIEDPFARVSTGNPQADVVLGGGFPANSINIVMGQPGTGKTVFVEQMLFRNASADRPIVYVSTLSEPMSKMVSYVQRFSYFDETKLGTEIQYEDIGPLLANDGLGALVPWMTELITRLSPKMIVIDSFRAIHDLAGSTPETRRMVSDLAGLLSSYDTTAFLLGEYTSDDIQRYPEFAVSDSIIQLARQPLGSRDERYLRVLKLRGSGYREGQHAFRITQSGIQLFPRLVSPRIVATYTPSVERASLGVSGIDAMLDGGVWAGTTTLVVGPTGSGKTTVAMHFALEGLAKKQPTLYVNFQENPAQLARAFSNLGANVDRMREGGLELMYVSPVELQIDSIVVSIFERIREGTIKRVVIDAVGDLVSAASDIQRLHDYLYSLVQHFAVNGVTSLLTFESGISGAGVLKSNEQRFSYMADNVLAIALGGEERTRRTIRVIKTRNSAHDPVVRQLEITGDGARIS